MQKSYKKVRIRNFLGRSTRTMVGKYTTLAPAAVRLRMRHNHNFKNITVPHGGVFFYVLKYIEQKR